MKHGKCIFLLNIFEIFLSSRVFVYHLNKSNRFPVGILLPLPAISGAVLQDPATFPLLSCRILRDPVAVIFDLDI
jgi:hypothetical protein